MLVIAVASYLMFAGHHNAGRRPSRRQLLLIMLMMTAVFIFYKQATLRGGAILPQQWDAPINLMCNAATLKVPTSTAVAGDYLSWCTDVMNPDDYPYMNSATRDGCTNLMKINSAINATSPGTVNSLLSVNRQQANAYVEKQAGTEVYSSNYCGKLSGYGPDISEACSRYFPRVRSESWSFEQCVEKIKYEK